MINCIMIIGFSGRWKSWNMVHMALYSIFHFFVFLIFSCLVSCNGKPHIRVLLFSFVFKLWLNRFLERNDLPWTSLLSSSVHIITQSLLLKMFIQDNALQNLFVSCKDSCLYKYVSFLKFKVRIHILFCKWITFLYKTWNSFGKFDTYIFLYVWIKDLIKHLTFLSIWRLLSRWKINIWIFCRTKAKQLKLHISWYGYSFITV